ncbi:MAG TPA: putative zinc-binding protein [Ferruginibacter sp.]|nr:putative zinc-binding protein [Ferruginibacter sp.]HRO17378.1 putative zinc-binding protein [Ferruginibacter sp.]HRQ21087.1 putative zinc-binding protein [Ferruginibacter sp.]
MMQSAKEKPLVYSCSGCSSAAQMANDLALKLDRQGVAEMSCIAGVGGHVKPLVVTATSGRRMIVLDGCVLACAKACLQQHGVVPTVHFNLSKFGVKKVKNETYCPQQSEEVYDQLLQQINTL